MRNKSGIFLKKYKVHVLVTLVFLLIAAGIPFDSYYQRQFEPEELDICSEAKEMTVITEDDPPVLLAGVGEGYTGIVAETANITLQKGTYTLQVVSLPEGEGNYIEVYSPRRLQSDNTQGELLVREELKRDSEVTELTFTTEESMEDVVIRIGYGGEGTLNVSGFYLVSAQRMYTDRFVLMGMILLISLLLLFWKTRGGHLTETDQTAMVVLTAAVLLVSLPLSFDSVLDGNDLYYQFNRILGIQEGLKSGQFPVKIHSTMLHGYGYGSSIFYPELFLYLPALLGCLGVSLINCYKTLIVLMNTATAFVSYRSFSGMTRSKETGLLASVFYTLSIYRLIDLYTRAALGEALAMIFLPLVMWGMYELFLGDSRKWYLAAFGFTGIMQSHVLTTELTIFFGVIFGICFLKHLKEKGRTSALLLAAGSTVLLNLTLILRLLQHAAYPFRVFFVDSTLSWWTVTLPKLFDLLLANPTERTYAGIQNSGEMPCSLGFVLLIGILAFLCVWFRSEQKDTVLRRCMFAFLLAVFGIYLSTNLFPWDKVQNLPFLYRLATSIQLPWRFLALSSALLCLVCAVGFCRWIAEPEGVRRAVCAGACVLAFLCAAVYINRYSEEAMPRYTTENQYQREQSQVDVLYFMNVDHANSYRIWNRENTFVPAEGIRVSNCFRGEDLTAEFAYECEDTLTGEERWVDVPFTYYPNYQAYASDGDRLETEVGDQGVLRVYLPEENTGTVTVTYQEPWYYQAGRLAALIGLFGIIFRMAWPAGKSWKEYRQSLKHPYR